MKSTITRKLTLLVTAVVITTIIVFNYSVLTGKIASIGQLASGVAHEINNIEKHSGRIELESKEGEGTKFPIYLPIETDETTEL